MLPCVARPNLYACASTSRVDINAVASVAGTRVLPNSNVNTIAVQPAGRAVAVRIVACHASGLAALRQVNHPHRTLGAHEAFARRRHIRALDACKARGASTAIRVNARVPIATVATLAAAAVLSWTLMIANCICMAVIFVQLARKHFLTYSTCACRCTAKVTPARIAGALVSVGTGVGAASV